MGIWSKLFTYKKWIKEVSNAPDSRHEINVAIKDFEWFWKFVVNKIRSSPSIFSGNAIDIFKQNVKGFCPNCGASITGEYIGSIAINMQMDGVVGISAEMTKFLDGKCAFCSSNVYSIVWKF